MEFKVKKSFGQNFLIDNSIIDKIINSVNVSEYDKILEIGPGKGYLTKRLKRYNALIYSFEIDLDTRNYLENLVDEKTNIFYQDFLTVNLNDYFDKEDRIHVIANIPYYITTPIIEHVIKSNLNILDMTLMVQKEVAQRLCAKPKTKDYGYISVYLNYYFELNKLFDVSKKCFDPVPKVDSAVIQLIKRPKKFDVKNESLFFTLIKDAFKMKRKNLKNNLKYYDLNIILDVLNKYNLNLQARAEELSVEIFVDIANNLTK